MVSGRTSVGVLGALIFGVFCLSVLFYTPQGSAGQAAPATQGGGWEVSTVSYEPPFNLQLDTQSIVVDEAAKTLTISGRFWVDANETVPAGEKRFGFSFGDTATAASMQDRDTGSLAAFTSVDAASLVHLETYREYDDAYYTTLPVVAAGTDKEFRLTFGYDTLPSGFIVYFGTGSTVLRVSSIAGGLFFNVSTSDLKVNFKQYSNGTGNNAKGRMYNFGGKISGGVSRTWHGSPPTADFNGWAGLYNNGGDGLRTSSTSNNAMSWYNLTTDQMFFQEAWRSSDNHNITIIEGHPLVVGMISTGIGGSMIGFKMDISDTGADVNNVANYVAYNDRTGFIEDTQLTSSQVDRSWWNGVLYYETSTSTDGYIILYNSSQYAGAKMNSTASYKATTDDNLLFASKSDGSSIMPAGSVSNVCWGVIQEAGTNQSAMFQKWRDEIIVTPDPAISAIGDDLVMLNTCKAVWINDTDNDAYLSYTLTPAAGAHATVTHTLWTNMSNVKVTWDGTECTYSWNGTAYSTSSCVWNQNVSVTRFSDPGHSSKPMPAMTTVTFKWYMFNTSTPRAVSISSATEASELEGRDAIDAGINNALGVGNWESFVDGQLQNREPGGYDPVGTFDRIAVWGNKTWAFNYLAGADSRQNLANLTPAVYVWEKSNMTVADITASVQAAIMGTMYT